MKHRVTLFVVMVIGLFIVPFSRTRAEAKSEAVSLICSLPSPGQQPLSSPKSSVFIEQFSGRPSRASNWQSGNWDIAVHSRDVGTWLELEPMQADHGEDCSPPPATHQASARGELVYQCNDHLMTAISASAYGVIYLTPNVLVDFSKEVGVIRWEVSTSRLSSRDWWDIWITPFEDNLVLPLDAELPDLAGPPRRGVHIALDYSWTSIFRGEILRNHVEHPIPTTDIWWVGYESFLTPSPTQREVFEMHIGRNYLKFGMPKYDKWWVDTFIEPLDWTEGVVQWGHHSYTPTKACDNDGTCGANTWHWDNMEIRPSRPFTMIKFDRDYVNESTNKTVFSNTPAPKDSFLRFSGIGTDLEVSFDGGKVWQSATLQKQAAQYLVEDHFRSYWMPLPQGVTEVMFRGGLWWNHPWFVKDIAIWSAESLIPTAISLKSAETESTTPLPLFFLFLTLITIPPCNFFIRGEHIIPNKITACWGFFSPPFPRADLHFPCGLFSTESKRSLSRRSSSSGQTASPNMRRRT